MSGMPSGSAYKTSSNPTILEFRIIYKANQGQEVLVMAQDAVFLTVVEVAQLARVWPDTVRIWLQRGKLKGKKLPGGGWRIKASDVEGMLVDE